MSVPDHSLTPFSLAFSWQAKLQFLNVIPFRLDHAVVYRVMRGPECAVVFTLEGSLLHMPVRYRQEALPRSLHNAVGEELKAAIESGAARRGQDLQVQFDEAEYDRVFGAAAPQLAVSH